MARTQDSRTPDARRSASLTQRRLTRTSRAARSQIGFSVGLGLVSTCLIIAQATLLAIVISGVFMGGESLGDVSTELIWLAAVCVARGLVSAGFESSGRFGASKVMAELRERLARHLLVTRPGAMQGEQSGELVTAAVNGVEALEAYFARYLPQVVLAGLVPIAVLIWVFPRDWEAGLILLVTAPLIPVFMILIGKLTEARTRKRWSLLSRLSSHFLDPVGGLETLRANGPADAQTASIADVGERYRRETMGTLRIGFLSALVLELLAMIGVAMVATAVGIQLVGGHIELKAGLTVLLLAPELYMPLRQLGNQFHASTDGMAAAERIFEVLDQPPGVEVPADPRPVPDPATSALEVHDLCFSHPGRGEILSGIDLRIEPGETVAIVGPSGGGKTTLLSILMRLADPETGSVSFGGTDLSDIDPREWRSRIGWVPQRPTIFTATLAENLRLGAPKADQVQLLDALDEVGLIDLVEQLDHGLETVVGSEGRRLSTGQAQRIAMARCFLRDAPILVLDEPTAHLDSRTEEDLSDAIARAAAGRTAIVVSHRNRPLETADRVLSMKAGRIEEITSPSAGGVA